MNDEQIVDVCEVYGCENKAVWIQDRVSLCADHDFDDWAETCEALDVAGAITADGPEPGPNTPEGWGREWV